ncbi:MAG: DUF1926 domain-containing protein [Campylobacterales bacterium]|nr:DUF1926 domain-containing protein [Campylobacterales bacterium]
MSSVHLLFGIHCHQPVDNFNEVVVNAINRAYKPFMKEVLNYPFFKFSVHFSGWLLEFIKEHDGELFSIMKELAKQDRIEFFTGGFYEPILCAIPSNDRVSQIKKLNTFIKKNFNQTPKGLWLTERVWDDSLIKDLVKCDIEYVIVDDYHFTSIGYKKENLKGYFITEDGGEQVKIFPIDKHLRYILPFYKPTSVIEYLNSLNRGFNEAAVIYDDGEKFGIWPKTYEWVYEKEWLKEFLEKLSESENIKVSLYKDFVNSQKSLGLCYLPTTSYYEMGEWSLKSDSAILLEKISSKLSHDGFSDDEKIFVKGSIWKNFLTKYYESNKIHKRTIELSYAQSSVKSKDYKDEMFKSQTNDVLWHGVFGGLYLPNLRDNAYRFIINCENIRYQKEQKSFEIKDFNYDGFDDVKVVTSDLITYFDSKCGAQMVELSLRDRCFNLQNTLTRYYESYHEKILNPKVDVIHSEGIDTIHNIKVENLDELKEHLIFDWYIKNSFIDHFSDKFFNIDSFEKNRFREFGDFANQPFLLDKTSTIDNIKFIRDGGIYGDGYNKATLIKQYSLLKNSILATLNFECEDNILLNYICEFNFHFANLKDISINSKPFETSFHEKSNIIKIKDKYTDKTITIECNKDVEVFVFAVNSVSQSEKGFDLTNQSLSVGFKYEFEKQFELFFKLSVK